LKAALDNPVFFVVVVAGYAASFGFLAAVLRKGLGLGVAYGIWAASGVTLVALVGVAFLAALALPKHKPEPVEEPGEEDIPAPVLIAH
jgi:small multidrug resistance pump